MFAVDLDGNVAGADQRGARGDDYEDQYQHDRGEHADAENDCHIHI